MLSEEIKHRAISFATGWGNIFLNNPRFHLDFSWPSLATTALLLSTFQERFDKDIQRKHALAAACYAVAVSVKFWEVSALKEGKISIAATVEDDEVVVKLTDKTDNTPLGQIVVSEILRNSSEINSVFFPKVGRRSLEGLKRVDRTKLLLQSLAINLIPTAPLDNLLSESLVATHLLRLDQALAESTARYFHRNYPSAKDTHDPILYRGLVLNDLLASDSTAPSTGSITLYNNLEVVCKSESRKSESLRCLAATPDFSLSFPAFILLVALECKEQVETLRRLSYRYYELRPSTIIAIEITRRYLKKVNVSEMLTSPSEKDQNVSVIISNLSQLLKLERQINLLTAPALTAEKIILNPQIGNLLYFSNFAEARIAIAKLDTTAREPWTLDYLLLLLREESPVENDGELIHTLLAEVAPQLEGDELFNLTIAVADRTMRDGQVDEAISLLAKYLDRDQLSSLQRAEILTKIGTCQNLLQLPQLAVDLFREAAQLDPQNMIARFNHVLFETKITESDQFDSTQLLQSLNELLKTFSDSTNLMFEILIAAGQEGSIT